MAAPGTSSSIMFTAAKLAQIAQHCTLAHRAAQHDDAGERDLPALLPRRRLLAELPLHHRVGGLPHAHL